MIASREGKTIINGKEENSTETTTRDGYTADVAIVGVGEVTETKKDQNGKEISSTRKQSVSVIGATKSREFENTGPIRTSETIETGIKVGLGYGIEFKININPSNNYANVAPTYTDNTGKAPIVPLTLKMKR